MYSTKVTLALIGAKSLSTRDVRKVTTGMTALAIKRSAHAGKMLQGVLHQYETARYQGLAM